MPSLQALRQATRLARLVLAWFALSLGVAIAAPMLSPQGMELVCTGSGAMKLVVKGADGQESSSALTLNCPMCGGTTAPPPVVPVQWAAPADPLSFALSRDESAHIVSVTAAPLSARAPPLAS